MEPPAAAAPAPAPDFAAVLQRLGIDQQTADDQREWIKNPANKQAMDALVPAKAERALLQTFARGGEGQKKPKEKKGGGGDAAGEGEGGGGGVEKAGGRGGGGGGASGRKGPDLDRASRWLTKALRHQPEMLNLPEVRNAEGHMSRLETGGWARIDKVLAAIAPSHAITRADLDEIVRTNTKQRLGISADGLKLRANQGHSCEVDMAYVEASDVPPLLFHGTSHTFLAAILEQGLKSMSRQYVHLTTDEETALKVGSRHGKDVAILNVDAQRMRAEGLQFYRSENGVWLTASVPPQYVSLRKA